MRVKEIYVYPIKSIRGISIAALEATATGFEYDRRFMLQKVSDGKNMHVSEFTTMCLFTTELSPKTSPSKITVRYAKDHVVDQPEQTLESQNQTLEIELTPNCSELAQVLVDMHSSSTLGYDMGDFCNDWFSTRLGFEVKLLYLGDNRRKVLGNTSPNAATAFVGDPDPKKEFERKTSTTTASWLGGLKATLGSVVQTVGSYAGVSPSNGIDEGISFADCAPFLIVSDKSWQDVQERVPDGEVVDISKFRPNIVVEGADAEFEEDYWAELAIRGVDQDEAANVRIILTQNCARCNSLNVDYETGKVGVGEAGSILKKLQRDRRVDPGMKYSPIFGRYGFLAGKGTGSGKGDSNRKVTVRVGDEVEVIRRNDRRTHFYWPGLA